jgi:hypothetical protein
MWVLPVAMLVSSIAELSVHDTLFGLFISSMEILASSVTPCDGINASGSVVVQVVCILASSVVSSLAINAISRSTALSVMGTIGTLAFVGWFGGHAFQLWSEHGSDMLGDVVVRTTSTMSALEQRGIVTLQAWLYIFYYLAMATIRTRVSTQNAAWHWDRVECGRDKVRMEPMSPVPPVLVPLCPDTPPSLIVVAEVSWRV